MPEVKEQKQIKERRQNILNIITHKPNLSLTEITKHYIKTIGVNPDKLTYHKFMSYISAINYCLKKLSEKKLITFELRDAERGSWLKKTYVITKRGNTK